MKKKWILVSPILNGNIIKTSIILLVLTTLISCKKDEVEEIEENNPIVYSECLLIETKVDGVTYSSIEYNSENKISKITTDNQITQYSYEGGFLSSIITTADNSSQTDFENDGTKIISSESHTITGTDTSWFTTTYTYSGDKIIKEESYNESGLLSNYSVYDWDGDNVSEWTFYSSNSTIIISETYTYDYKNNPFHGTGLFNTSYLASRNNVKSVTNTSGETFTYNYEYNSNDYPTKHTDRNSAICEYIYNCY